MGYPGASRVLDPLVHTDMGVTAKFLIFNNDAMKSLDRSQLQILFKSKCEEISSLSSKIKEINGQIQKFQKYQNKYKQSYGIAHTYSVQTLQKLLKKELNKLEKNKAKEKGKYAERDIIIEKIKGTLVENAWAIYQQKLKEFNIYNNRYFKNMEGNQCKQYRKKWIHINEHIKNTKYYLYMGPVIRDYNALFKILCQSKPFVSLEECERAKKLLSVLLSNWLKAKKELKLTQGLPPKFHYFYHEIETMFNFKAPSGWWNDQSMEGLNQIGIGVMDNYSSLRGIDRVKYASKKLFLITSPTYSGEYTNEH